MACLRQGDEVEGLEEGDDVVDDLGREGKDLVFTVFRGNTSYGGVSLATISGDTTDGTYTLAGIWGSLRQTPTATSSLKPRSEPGHPTPPRGRSSPRVLGRGGHEESDCCRP